MNPRWTPENCYDVTPAGCWEWRGHRTHEGYGTITRKGFNLAHRWMYDKLVGPIPDGLTLDHLCRNTSCVNPAHLEPVTIQENTRRHWASQTHCKHGHLFDAENTYYRPSGHRACRRCNAARSAAYKARRLAQ